MNPYEIVECFENAIAAYTGFKHAVAVDSCTNAIFLCAKYLRIEHATIPSRTYPSVPCSIIQAGGKVHFEDLNWRDDRFYKLTPNRIYDAAHLFCKDVSKIIKEENALVCVSFSATKPVNIGKGGMILTNDEKSINWFKQARYCGRHEKPLMEDTFEMMGWNMYMTPEQAARGLLLMNDLSRINLTPIPEYPDLSQYDIYKEA